MKIQIFNFFKKNKIFFFEKFGKKKSKKCSNRLDKTHERWGVISARGLIKKRKVFKTYISTLEVKSIISLKKYKNTMKNWTNFKSALMGSSKDFFNH